KKILMEYDPKQYERDHKIEGNKKLYEVNKDIEISLEEMGNIRKEFEEEDEENKKDR
ncbi:hypothetical protein GQ568_02680, partial [Patescibacteria group bacterium]|nr:hypothetical protein [Patescibacteria group bacterium]